MEEPPHPSPLRPTQIGPSETPPAEPVPAQAKDATGQAAIPASSKAIRLPLRPAKGSFGTRCLVKANHFIAQLPDKNLHH